MACSPYAHAVDDRFPLRGLRPDRDPVARPLRLLGGALAGVLILGGCDGGDQSSPPPSPTTTTAVPREAVMFHVESMRSRDRAFACSRGIPHDRVGSVEAGAQALCRRERQPHRGGNRRARRRGQISWTKLRGPHQLTGSRELTRPSPSLARRSNTKSCAHTPRHRHRTRRIVSACAAFVGRPSSSSGS